MSNIAEYKAFANKAAIEYGINPSLFRSMITVESGWDPTAVSSAGAAGLGQLMPFTAQEMGLEPHERFNPLKNLRASAGYFRKMLNSVGGNERLALMAYNAGLKGLQRPAARAQASTYADRVLSGAAIAPGKSGCEFNLLKPGEWFKCQADSRRFKIESGKDASDFPPPEAQDAAGCNSFSFLRPSTWGPALKCAFTGALVWFLVIALVVYAAWVSRG